MDSQQGTPLPPPSTPPAEPHSEGSFGPLLGLLLGLIAWGVGFALWSTAEDADVPTENYFGMIAMGIVGATLLIVSAIYDATR